MSGVVFGRAPAIMVPTEADKAYAAGFFDGEGNVCIAANHGVPEAKGTIYNMRIGASQNDITPLLWLRDRWGGSVQPASRKTTRQNTTYAWSCFARKAAAFLEDVLPYLQVKRERAALALAFQAEIFNPGCGGHAPEYRERLAAYRAELNRLNSHKPSRAEAA